MCVAIVAVVVGDDFDCRDFVCELADPTADCCSGDDGNETGDSTSIDLDGELVNLGQSFPGSKSLGPSFTSMVELLAESALVDVGGSEVSLEPSSSMSMSTKG